MELFFRRLIGFLIMMVFVAGGLILGVFIALAVAFARLFGKKPRIVRFQQINLDLNNFNPRPPPRDVTPKHDIRDVKEITSSL